MGQLGLRRGSAYRVDIATPWCFRDHGCTSWGGNQPNFPFDGELLWDQIKLEGKNRVFRVVFRFICDSNSWHVFSITEPSKRYYAIMSGEVETYAGILVFRRIRIKYFEVDIWRDNSSHLLHLLN